MDKRKFKEICGAIVRISLEYNVFRASAALCYFLTLSVFPTLICLYNMMGSLFPASNTIWGFLEGVIPENALNTILDFLRYVAANTSDAMLVLALSLLLSSASAAFRTVDNMIGEMRGKRRYSGFWGILFSLVFSLMLLVGFYLSMLLIVTGKGFLDFLDRYVMFMNFSDIWAWARFTLLFLLLFLLLLLVYRITAPKGKGFRALPGAAIATAALVTVSAVFSAVISNNTRYPLVYGSLGSLFIMMFWLYICGIVLFLGSALNVVLERLDHKIM